MMRAGAVKRPEAGKEITRFTWPDRRRQSWQAEGRCVKQPEK
jgi:hypothetical protein